MHSYINVDTAALFTPKLHLNVSIECNDMLIILGKNVTHNGASKSNMLLNYVKFMLLMTLGTTDNVLMTK